MNKTASALLEAQVEYELDALTGESFERLVDAEVSELFGWFAEVSLNDVATRERVVSVIDRRAIELRISGGITELMGEMANKVFTSERNEDVRLEDIVPSRSFEEIVDKVVSLEQARGELIRRATQSGAYRTLIHSVLQRSVLDFVFPSNETTSARLRSSLARLGRDAVRRVVPALELRIASLVSRYLEENADRIAREGEKQLLLALDQNTLRRAAAELWEELAPMRLSELFAQIEGYDLEDFVVFGYEFWLKYRKTEYFRGIVHELVGHFFDKYGDESLLSLIEDMGVTQEMVTTDVRAFAGPVLAHARATGFLERRIRAHLEPFYASEQVAALVDGPRTGRGVKRKSAR